MEVCNILLKKSNTECTCKKKKKCKTTKKIPFLVKMLYEIQPLLRKKTNRKKPYYFPLNFYTKTLILLSLIMEVCNILLKKSNTKSTYKPTNAKPQIKCLSWLKCYM